MKDERSHEGPPTDPSEDAVTETRAEHPAPRLPKQIGQFHIKDVLASGGMGVVYRAVQSQPRRTVAVKVMRHGVTSRSALRRFEYESQILARLHHPGIAQVYEAGTHDDGQGVVPYFAMEYVANAKAITQYAKEKSLGPRERLELLASVCDAVHHGHQKGIVHRDLKPGNILVDPNGNVKVIDFGVARGTDSDLALTTLQTEVGQLIGTLQYMSPEQCDADPDAIDARSDVYALGVVLYELLTGRLPYKIRGHAAHSSTDVIREQPPTRPSTIDRTLRGDVETIVLQALVKDPERRYRSAAAFARDIRAYLAGEAIRARPPSAVYRVQLFGRRHKALLSSVAVLAAVALASALLVDRSHRRATQAEEATAAALERATQAEAAVAESTLGGEAGKRKGTDMIGRQVGDFSLTTLDGKTLATADFARYEATVLNFVNAACPHCIEQVPLVEKMRTEYDSKGVRFLNIQVPMGFDGGQSAEEAREAFAQIGSQIEFAQDESKQVNDVFKVGGVPTLSIVDSSGKVRQVYIGSRGDLMARLRGVLDALILGRPTPEEALAEAEELHRQALKNNRQTLGEGHRDTLRSMEDLAETLTRQGKHDEAEELYREIWSVRRQFLGENDPRTLESMHRLAVVLQRRGKPAEAETILRETVELRRHVLGGDDPATRLSMAHLGMVLRAQEKHEEAKPFMPALLELRKREAQARDADATTLNRYALLLLTSEPAEVRDPATALEVARSAVELSGRQEEGILDTLALAEKENGDLQTAIEILKEALLLLPPAAAEEREPLRARLVSYYQEVDDLEGLEDWLREELARMRASVPPTSMPMAFALVGLGKTLIASGQPAEAEPLLREAHEIGRGALPEGHWGVAGLESLVGLSLVAQGRFEEAEPIVVESFLRLKDDRTVMPEVLDDAHATIVRLFEDWGKPDEAARYRAMAPRGNEGEPH